ncbi:MAG: site-2 protease family protein, partial [Actinomycetota bacterium]
MLQLLGIVIFVIGLLVSIGLHELGHMVPAKKFGVRVSEYFVGFGPTLWSRKGKETEYGVKAIPLGGYVRLVGMIPPEEAVKPVKGHGRIANIIADARSASVDEVLDGEDYRAFYHLTWWRKVIVMFGGPFVNLVLAIVLFTVVQV